MSRPAQRGVVGRLSAFAHKRGFSLVPTPTKTPQKIAAVRAPQQGTADFPRGDVFGGWTVDGFSVYSGAWPEVVPWASAPDDLDSCNQVLELLPLTKDSDTTPIFPIEPSFPGWPE